MGRHFRRAGERVRPPTQDFSVLSAQQMALYSAKNNWVSLEYYEEERNAEGGERSRVRRGGF